MVVRTLLVTLSNLSYCSQLDTLAVDPKHRLAKDTYLHVLQDVKPVILLSA